MRLLLKDPLIHFLLIGAALFAIAGWKGRSATAPGTREGMPTTHVFVPRAAVEQLRTQFARTWQRPPTEDEEMRLVEDYIRNEIFYREALAIGLDRDDEVFKRRLRQRMEFVYEDISSWGDPTDTDLRAFMEKHREKYFKEAQVSFRQVFINTDKRGQNAPRDATEILSQLAQGTSPDSLGDVTLLPSEVALSPLSEVGKQFGDAFVKSLAEIKPGKWAGPVRSSYGMHLVLVKELQPIRLPELAEASEKLKRDWIIEKQGELKDAAYAKIRQRYSVTVEKPNVTTAPASVADRGRPTR